jgi:SagB-type dehydrogenase family enzyme
LARTDWPLTRALEARRSLRDHAEPPITRRQLGEFLYRTAAIRSIRDDVRYPTTRRVYPSGGAAYALELYVVARRCRGLAPGLYHYGPDRHDLTPVAGMTPAVQSLVGGAAAAARSAPPHILIVMAARFLRAAWKYSSISYALILKDVGALMQTMYLTATAMGLGGCAIGGGDSDLFAKAAGTNYYDESSVGEFILGRVARTKG